MTARLPSWGVNQNESLPVLIARGVEIFIIGGGELPVNEHGECMAIRLRIGRYPLRQQGGGHCRVGPELNCENVAGIVPRGGGSMDACPRESEEP